MQEIKKEYYTVQDEETLRLLFQHIADSEALAYDTETTSLNMRKGKVIGWSVTGKLGVGFYLPILVWNAEKQVLEEQFINGTSARELSIKLLGMLIGKKLIMDNASFDCRYTKNDLGVNLLPSLWVDTALLVHTVQEEGAGMGVFGLKPLAISVQDKIGLDVEKSANEEQIRLKESIKKNGGSVTKANYEIFKADLEILSEYASADTDLTYRLCYHFLKVLEKEGLEDFFFNEEVMPIYREVTIPMEDFGVDLDMELLNKTLIEITKDLEENKKVVIGSILARPEAKEWVMDTAFKKYPPNHKGNWAQELVNRYSLPLPRSEKTGKYSLTQKNIEELEDSKVKEFLQTGDNNLLDEVELARISMSLWKEENDGELVNIQSKDHLGDIVFNYMGVKAKSKTKKGKEQFDMDMIEHLSKTYDWAENLRIYNKLLKIKSTYIDRFLDNNEDGRYYFYYKQNGTVSGRYGSDAQQLPKPKEEGEDVPIIVNYTNLVRAFLISGEGRLLIDADYTSLEPHCFASVTGDKNLQDIFNNGWDFYSTIAIKTEKLEQDTKTYPNGVSSDTKSPVFLKKIDPVKRNKAKGYALGVPYGMEDFALGKTLDIPQKEAKVLVKGYLDGFPQLKEWMEASRVQVKEHGYIKNYVGRIRHLPKVKVIFSKVGDQMLDWRFRKRLEEVHGKAEVLQLYRDYKNGLNNCLNYQLQSLAASVVNRAALKINRKAIEMGIDAVVQAQVHDQLIINVRKDQAKEFAPIAQEIMENNLVLPGVTLKAPPEISINWRDGH